MRTAEAEFEVWPPGMDVRRPDTMRALEAQLWRELEVLRFQPHETRRLAQRRERLAALFRQAAPWDAEELSVRLMLRLPGDRLGQSFRHRLSTPTRRTLLQILRDRAGSIGQLEAPGAGPLDLGQLDQPLKDLLADKRIEPWRRVRRIAALFERATSIAAIDLLGQLNAPRRTRGSLAQAFRDRLHADSMNRLKAVLRRRSLARDPELEGADPAPQSPAASFEVWPPGMDVRRRNTMLALEAVLWNELEVKRLLPHETLGLQQRRDRLADLFRRAAPWDAAELHSRLLLRSPGDKLARSFHYRLATPTRRMLLEILRRRGAPASQLEAEDEPEYQASPASPAFRLICAGGCHVGGLALTEASCRTTLRTDLARGIGFATAAAQLLETASRPQWVRQLYRQAFAHFPERAVPWAPGFSDSGMLTARRFRMVGQELGGRVVHFRCEPQPATHPCRNAEVPARDSAGRTNRTEVVLFTRYWSQRPAVRAGILAHEILHLIFAGLFSHHRVNSRRTVNPHCYEWLLLRLNRQVPEAASGTCRDDLAVCHDSPP